MNLDLLTEHERNIVYKCLEAALYGPFFPDWEFNTLFGINRTELSKVIKDWPNIETENEIAFLAVNGSLGQLLGYPHGEESELEKRISASREEIRQIFDKLQK